MSAKVTTTELRKMQPKDLLKEINSQQNAVVKLRLGVKLGKEKDSAKYIREKKQLARMKTVYSQAAKAEQTPAAATETKKQDAPQKKAAPKKSTKKS